MRRCKLMPTPPAFLLFPLSGGRVLNRWCVVFSPLGIVCSLVFSTRRSISTTIINNYYQTLSTTTTINININTIQPTNQPTYRRQARTITIEPKLKINFDLKLGSSFVQSKQEIKIHQPSIVISIVLQQDQLQWWFGLGRTYDGDVSHDRRTLTDTKYGPVVQIYFLWLDVYTKILIDRIDHSLLHFYH